MSRQVDSLRSELRARLPEMLPGRLGVAVSGGGDSVALMHLLQGIAQRESARLFVITVDHGLRSEAAHEAKVVAEQAAQLGLSHETLRWGGWDGAGNLQDRARQARYSLLTDWARGKDISAVALGHTADDQAETVLMRLGRAAGVTGLAAMPFQRHRGGIELLRPMLGITRQRLRDYLTEIGVGWIEDPSNQDNRFDRIKAREALSNLEVLGIMPETLSRVAENLAQAREALALFAQESARKVARVEAGDILVDRVGFAALPDEIRRRILVGAVLWIAGRGYPPRQTAIDQAEEALLHGRAGAIGGCLLIPQGHNMWICREFKAVEGLTVAAGAQWDGRWILTGPATAGARISALGESGLQCLPDWRAIGRPRLALKSSPAVWQGDALLAAPLAGYANGWRAEPAPEWTEFHTSILSH
ncbi:tRNA lysidine(34) synthetase TilS [Rhodobacteraceae bacterium B1Z28]|uniref:tRNA(Ile)-lysidine synthase n=1 Tax=Ruegeria haliotis TaxID=2747601 RepID=A0ABX2PTR5_9RHOB|nr:tRNA lysidine(34) synthetase TilS [Ruegeria haliotis]